MTDVKRHVNLFGKIAVVTGAARGIGRAAATALAGAGADIAGGSGIACRLDQWDFGALCDAAAQIE